jgi:hypothetical protein
MTTAKHVPLAEVSRLRQDRRKLQAEVARLKVFVIVRHVGFSFSRSLALL